MNHKYIYYYLQTYNNPFTMLLHEFAERQCVCFCGLIAHSRKEIKNCKNYGREILGFWGELEFLMWNKIEKTTRDFLYRDNKPTLMN